MLREALHTKEARVVAAVQRTSLAQETVHHAEDVLHLKKKVKTNLAIPLAKRYQIQHSYRGKVFVCKHVRQPFEEIFNIREMRVNLIQLLLDVL